MHADEFAKNPIYVVWQPENSILATFSSNFQLDGLYKYWRGTIFR